MFNIRLADISDCERIFNLSNDPVVRNNSINKEKILWENHVKWFENRIKNINEPFYIVETPDGDLIAQVRFNKENNENIISVSITKDFRGKGLGAEVISESSQKTKLSPIFAYVKENNIASKRAFIKAGYIEKEFAQINNELYIKLALLQ